MSASRAADDRPWLSLLVPAHDVAPYIGAMLASATTQADDGVEIVVVDDASTDATADVVAGIAAVDARLRMLRNPHNRGVAATRNRLLAEARGRHVWFVDADDLLADGAITALRGVIERTQADVVTCDFRTIGGTPWSRRRRRSFDGPRDGDDARELLAGSLRAAQLHVCWRIARRELWGSAPFPARQRFEDMGVVAGLLARASRWHHAGQAWIGYRQRAGSLSRRVPVDSLAEHSQALREVGAIVRAAGDGNELRDALDYFLLRGHASIARRLARLPDVEGEARAIAAACLAQFRIDFPDDGDAALAACRRRGWWLRAHRVARALERAGWR